MEEIKRGRKEMEKRNCVSCNGRIKKESRREERRGREKEREEEKKGSRLRVLLVIVLRRG